MTERGQTDQLVDWIVSLFSAEAEPSPTRDYYLVQLRQGRGVPESVGLAVDDLLEEVRTAVSRGEPYNPRAHRGRLGLPSTVPFSAHRLPRPALVRRLVLERVGAGRPQPPRQPGRREGSRPSTKRHES
ncbi:MAG TPA: hypothetical protein VKX16_07715 [Chloroflexota bacterium]|nr:hypothetical protein [Chloroflexota bacterium]